jgi:capsular polysaccharide transport system permease protein
LSTVAGTPLAYSLAIQLRVIHALLLREAITRYGRHGLGVLWIMLEPMLFTLGVAALWYIAKMHTLSNIPIIAFAITGYSSVLMWRNAASRCSKAIEPNLSLMYHRNVKVIDIFLSRIILEWVGATASITVLTVFFASIGALRWPSDIWLVLQGWFFLAWFSLGLGLIVGAISERSETFERTWHIFTYLLFPLSGAMFMVHWLPTDAQNAILWLPMVHGVEMMRHGYFGEVVPTYENPAYFAVANLVLMLIGLLLAHETGRKVQPE